MHIWLKTTKYAQKHRDDIIIAFVILIVGFLILDLPLILYFRNIDLKKEKEKYEYEESWKNANARLLQSNGKYIYKRDNKWCVHFEVVTNLDIKFNLSSMYEQLSKIKKFE